MAVLRVLGLLLVVLLAVRFALGLWLRLRERRRLADEWEIGAWPDEREDFVRAGIAAYDRSPRPRLLWLVVILPMAAFAVLLYLLNVA